MTKTIKELPDEIEKIFDYNLSLHKPEGRKQLERVISQVEALVREQTVEEILELAYDVNLDDRGASPLYAVTGEEIKDYAKTKNITL